MIKLLRRYAHDNPLGNRVWSSIFLCSTCLACIATGLQLFLDYRSNMSGIELRMLDIKRSYPGTLAESIWNVDTPQIHTQIEGIASLPDIVGVQLKDAEGKLLEVAGSSQKNHLVVTEEFPIEYSKNASAGHPTYLGKLIVTASVERIYTELRNKALVILLSQTAKTTIVAIFTLFIFNYLVSRHLSTLAAYARKIDLKNLNTPIILSRPPNKTLDELDVVVSAFNTMSASLQKDYDEIQKYKDSLEHLVEQRTDALAQRTDALAKKISEKEDAILKLNHEITERELAENEARNNEERYRQLVEMLPDAITIEVNQKIVFCNQSIISLLLAESIQQLHGKSITDFIPQEWHIVITEHRENSNLNTRACECKITRFDGTLIDVEISQSIFHYKGQDAIQTIIHDITKHKHYEEQLRRQALHDALTDLPNRILLNDRIMQEIHLAERQKQMVYIIFLDLDRFKYVNDTLGHDAGDVLLKIISTRMLKCLRKSDTLARLGGDEFVVVLARILHEPIVFKLVSRIMSAIAEPIMLNDQEVCISASIGISAYPKDGLDSVTLLKHADSAMYQAKSSGKGKFQQYSQEMHERVNEHLVMESRLHHAIERNELVLYYQPIIDFQTKRIIAAEALIRWQHPTLGLIAPMRFIPLAEETGLIIPIGSWVIQAACQQFKQWKKNHFPLLRVSVNLSTQQIVSPHLEVDIKQALEDAELPPECLELEITESASIINPDQTILLLHKLKAMGLGLAIDDFGTGYSNLSYLKELPVDHLKLDRVFVRDICHSSKDAMLARSIIDIAHHLNLKVIAEGVEEKEQMEQLMLYQCDEMQGFYYSPPLPIEKFDQLVLDQQQILQTQS